MSGTPSRTVVIACLHLLIAPVCTWSSNWSHDANINNPVSTAFDRQQNPEAISDGESGVIVAWQDLRNQLFFDVYAQRINGNGDPVWTLDGVLLSDVVANRGAVEVVSDGAGGAIVTWLDQRSDVGDLYAQRIDAAGNILWASGGVPIVVAASEQAFHQMIADGNGGAIIAWTDERNGPEDIYAQKIDANGVVQWPANGVAVCQAADVQFSVRLTSDGAGGAVLAWEDRRNDPVYEDVYAQRVDSAGNPLWTADGIAIAQQPFAQGDIGIATGFTNGAFIVWEDWRDGVPGDPQIYVQRVLGDGTPVFAANGIQVSTLLNGNHTDPQVVSVDAIVGTPFTGIWMMWYWTPNGGMTDIALRSIGASGELFFAETVVDADDGFSQRRAHLAAVPNTQAMLIAWEDDRNGPNTSDIFMTKYLAGFEFPQVGVRVCVAAGEQQNPRIVPDNLGGAIVVWEDDRASAISTDIYAQRIDLTGTAGYASPDINSIVDNPQDQGGQVVVSWDRSRYDVSGISTIVEYSLWRRNMTMAKPGPPSLVSGATRVERALAAGVPEALAYGQIQSGWELVGVTPAIHLPDYAMTASTYGDSTGAGIPFTGFQVVVEYDFGFYYSAVDSGFSVDNLTPSKPLNLTGETVGSDALLIWELGLENSDDVVAYNVYRNLFSGVAPVPGNWIATVPDLTHLDTTTGGALHYYIVTALDPSNQESPPSNEVSVPEVSDVGDRPLPTVLAVAANAPNPTDGPTTLRFGLPSTSNVVIRMFDVAGRRVFTETLRDMPAGWHAHRFDGRDHEGNLLPAGIYFYTIRAGATSRTNRLIVTR